MLVYVKTLFGKILAIDLFNIYVRARVVCKRNRFWIKYNWRYTDLCCYDSYREAEDKLNAFLEEYNDRIIKICVASQVEIKED